MATVDMDKAVELAIDMVRNAHAKDKLQHLTNRLVRQEIEQSLELETGLLEEKLYKKRINEAIAATVELLEARKDVKDGSGGKTKKERRESAAQPSSSSKKHKSEAAEVAEVKKSKPRSYTKSASAEKTRKEDESVENKASKEGKRESGVVGKAPASGEKRRNYKSKELIVSDDEEEDNKKDIPASPVSAMPAKNKEKRLVISDSEDESKPNTSPKKRRKLERAPSKEKRNSDTIVTTKSGIDAKMSDEGKKDVAADDAELKSDSELSVLLDSPLTKRGKKSKKVKKFQGDAKEKKPRVKKETKELSPDEEQIKKLKSFIVACGVRKIWSKELKDCETLSSQISHLRKMLTDLGMKGRFSLEQAKAIKAKRDLAKEMEDVQEFAQRHAGDRPRQSPSKAKLAVADVSSDEESDEEAEPSRRPKNAHRSIMDFLGDQSGSD